MIAKQDTGLFNGQLIGILQFILIYITAMAI